MINSQFYFGFKDEYNAFVGSLYSMLHQIIETAKQTGYQPPHWDREPSSFMLKEEELFREEASSKLKETEKLIKKLNCVLLGRKLNA